MIRKIIFFLTISISIYSAEITEIIRERSSLKNNFISENKPKIFKDDYTTNTVKEKDVHKLIESEYFKEKYGEIFYFQRILYKEMDIDFLRVYFFKNNESSNIPINIVDFYLFNKTEKIFFINSLGTTMSKNTIISIAKNNDIPRYSGLYFNFPGKILVDNLSIPNLKYNEYDSILEIKKKKENSKHSNLKIIFEEIEVFFHNIFSKRKKYAYYLEYNKRVDKEIIILDNILMYLNTNNKELLNEITYFDLNNIALNKIREYNTNPILKNLSLGFKMKFYKNEITDEKLEENINSKIQNSLNEDAVLRLLDRITKDKLGYENNQLEKSYENKFD